MTSREELQSKRNISCKKLSINWKAGEVALKYRLNQGTFNGFARKSLPFVKLKENSIFIPRAGFA